MFILNALEIDRLLGSIEREMLNACGELDFCHSSVDLPIFGSRKRRWLGDIKSYRHFDIGELAQILGEQFSRDELQQRASLVTDAIDAIEEKIARVEQRRDEMRFLCLLYPIIVYNFWTVGNAPDLVKLLLVVALATIAVKVWTTSGEISFLYKKSCRIRYEAEVRYLAIHTALANQKNAESNPTEIN